MPETEQDAISTADERQPYHLVDGKVLTQIEWREKMRNAVELLEMFKQSAYRSGEI